MRIRLIGALIAMLALLVSAGAVAAKHGDKCGEAPKEYWCGEIVVYLGLDTEQTIEDVVTAVGGNPTSDILERFPAIEAYVVAVDPGAENEALGAYAAVDRVDATILYPVEGEIGRASSQADAGGSGVPDTAVSAAEDSRCLGVRCSERWSARSVRLGCLG